MHHPPDVCIQAGEAVEEAEGCTSLDADLDVVLEAHEQCGQAASQRRADRPPPHLVSQKLRKFQVAKNMLLIW